MKPKPFVVLKNLTVPVVISDMGIPFSVSDRAPRHGVRRPRRKRCGHVVSTGEKAFCVWHAALLEGAGGGRQAGCLASVDMGNMGEQRGGRKF